MSADFTEMSRVLTGESVLDSRLAQNYEVRLRSYFGDVVDQLVGEFAKQLQSQPGDKEQALRAALGEVADFHALAREIIRLWYTGQFQTPFEDIEPPREVEDYSAGLLWRVIKAHAPGFTNAGYGAWETLPP